MQYTVADIRKAFDPATFRRGLGYFEEGRVLRLESADNGHILSGSVRGEVRQPYSTQVQLREDARRFSSRCTCSVRSQCKHAVALLLAALERPPKEALGADISAWVDDLFELHQDEKPAKRGTEREPGGLSFHCTLPSHPEPHLAVSVQRMGHGGKPMSLNARWQRGHIQNAEIRGLFNRLRGFADESPYTARLHDAGSGALLEDLVKSGHCHWENSRRALRQGEPREAEAQWQLHEDGSQSLTLSIGPGIKVLPLEPPCYLDTRKHVAGPITTDLSPAILPLLNRAPRIAPHQVEEFIELLDQRGLSGVPRPALPRARDVSVSTPQARLELMHIDDLVERGDGFVPDIYVARLQACYQGFGFNPGEGEDVVLRKNGNQLLRIRRDLKAERDLLAELTEFHDVALPNGHSNQQRILTPYDGPSAWADFLDHRMARLEQQNWQIEQRDSFDLALIEPEQWQLQTRSRDNDWFELSAGFKVDGENHNLLDLLVKLLREADDPSEVLPADGKPLIVDLGGGRMLRLPHERIARVLNTLVELFREHPLNRAGSLKLHKLDLARLEHWSEDWSWTPPDDLRAFARSLSEAPPQAEIPANFTGELRGYQQAGLAWMQNLDRHGFSGLLADDMGLGKTVQTLAHIAALQAREPRGTCLIVAPTSVIGNWRAEARRFTPDLKVLLWHGKERHGDGLRDADLVITSYGTLLRDEKTLEHMRWRLIVLDEAQAIKNPRAKIAGCVKRVKAQQRLCLSGTPMENHLGELWSLFDFLAPGFLGDARSFKQLYRTPIEKHADEKRSAQLSRRVQAFLLRRRKEEVATELPPKSDILRTVTLGDEQAELYETIRLSMEQRIRDAVHQQGLERSQIVILDALLKLRQICCDPRLVKLEQAIQACESAKLQALMDMLGDLIPQGRRVLVFSQFTEMLALIEDELNQRKLPYLKLTGSTRNRQELVDAFQQGTTPLFLISLKAGGTGLNLTAADTVIHYDPWWNPAVENQASDRAHRIGQDKPVFVYKLICENTVEERIQLMQERKRALSQQIFQAEDNALGEDDLEWLLQPVQDARQ